MLKSVSPSGAGLDGGCEGRRKRRQRTPDSTPMSIRSLFTFPASRKKFQESVRKKKRLIHKDEDVTCRSLLDRHFQPIYINRTPCAVNMFADQIEGIAAFAREHPLPALTYLILLNIFFYILFTEVERYNARIAGF